MWDLRNFSEPIATAPLGSGQSVCSFHYNNAHQLLYSAGRGSMDVGIYKYDSSIENCLRFYSNSQSPQPTIGFSLMPREALDIRRHEVDRAVRLVNDKTIVYVGFTLKNRTDTFQPDLYPPFPSTTPSNTFDEWAAGTDKPANMKQFTEDDFNAVPEGGAKAVKLAGFGDSAKLQEENDKLKAQLAEANAMIEKLQAELAAAQPKAEEPAE